MKKNINYHKGVTLIELMIAVTISLVLLLGVGSIYSNSKRNYLVQDEFGYMQENARTALKFLVKDVRMTGFLGCAWNNIDDTRYTNGLASTGDAEADAQFTRLHVGLEGYEANSTGANTPTEPNTSVISASAAGNWHTAIPAFINTTDSNLPALAAQGSDMIVVRYADGSGVKLVANKESNNFWIVAPDGDDVVDVDGINCQTSSGICEGDILLITDCEKSRLFQVTSGMSYSANVPTGGPGTPGVKLNHAAAENPAPPGNLSPPAWGAQASEDDFFDPIDSEILKASAFIYYVGMGSGNEPALFRQAMHGFSAAQELVQGVENMQILYGIDTDKSGPNDADGFDGIANRYVTAAQVDLAADNVVSARISLLMATSREVSTTAAAPAAKDYILAGMTAATGTTVTAPADKRIRKVYTTTVKLRNKGVQD